MPTRHSLLQAQATGYLVHPIHCGDTIHSNCQSLCILRPGHVCEHVSILHRERHVVVRVNQGFGVA